MFCTECGQQNADDARFCTECGKKIKSLKTVAQPCPSQPTPAYEQSELKESGIVTVMAAVGFVFGLISMMGSFIPSIGSLAFYIGIPASLVSAIALGIAYSQNFKRTFAIVSVTICLIGMIISGWQYFSIISAGKSVERELKKTINQDGKKGENVPSKTADESQIENNNDSFVQAKKAFEAHRIEQEKIEQLRKMSIIPSAKIGTYPCFNLHFNQSKIPPEEGEVVLTDVSVSYVHVFPNEKPYQTNVIFNFENITNIKKNDDWGTFNVHFNLRNAVWIRSGDTMSFIRFKEAAVRDIFYDKLIAAKKAWDQKYPMLR